MRCLRELDVDVGLIGKHLPQRVGDVAGRDLRGRHLVEQRLELVVVVAIDQRDPHVLVVSQLARTPKTGEARRRR